jgi:hypothetical protein
MHFESGARLSTLADRVFQDCSALWWIRIPAAVDNLTGLTFVDFPHRLVEIDEWNSAFDVLGSFLVNFERNSAVRYLGREKAVLVDNDCEGIDEGCFHSRTDISTVDFEDGSRVSFFGRFAFLQCSGLSSFRIPSTVETIGKKCFQDCSNLRRVTFESVSRVAVIGDEAFASCDLQSIALPSSVTTIGSGCFRACPGLATVTVEPGSRVSVIGPDAFSGCPSRLPISRRRHGSIVIGSREQREREHVEAVGLLTYANRFSKFATRTVNRADWVRRGQRKMPIVNRN